jgi:hypothetical protein
LPRLGKVEDVGARELREVDIDLPAWMRSNPVGDPGDWLLGVERPQSRAPVDLFGWHLVICSSPLSCAATAAVRCNSGWPRQPQPQFSRAPARTPNCSRTQPSTRLIAVPNDFWTLDQRPPGRHSREPATHCCPVRASSARSALADGTPEHDQAVAEGGCSHGMSA